MTPTPSPPWAGPPPRWTPAAPSCCATSATCTRPPAGAADHHRDAQPGPARPGARQPRAIAAIDEIFDRSGAGTISSSNPIQRLWRDAHAGRHHTVNSVDRSLHSYGMTAMGFNPTDVMI